MAIKNRSQLLWIVSALMIVGTATAYVSTTLLKADSISSATIPAAPTGLTASYSTANLGQPEVRLTVTDNATDETYYQLYWHLSGTTWPNTAPKDTYSSAGTWSQPINVGGMQIFAPSVGGTYEYQLQACNSAGCSSSNIVAVSVPGTLTTPNAPSSLLFDPAPTANTIFLKWTDNSSNETSFAVDRKFITDGNYAGTLHWATLPANTTSFSDTNVVPGQHYDYRVVACNASGCSDSINRSNAVTASNVCTSLDFRLLDNKTSYNSTTDNVNYSYKCIPEGTSAPSVAIQVVKPDGTATTYVTGGNVGAVLQQMGFSTSNLVNGLYILRACLNDTSCATGVYPLPFTVIGGIPPVVKQTPAPVPNASPSTTLITNPNQNSNFTPTMAPIAPTTASVPTVIPQTPTTTTTTLPATATIPQKPTAPQTAQIPTAAQIAPTPAMTGLTGLKCTRYLSTAKNTLDSNERYMKNIELRMKIAPKNYVNLDTVTALFASANSAIREARDLIKNKDCSGQALGSIQNKQADINNTLQDISVYDQDEFQYFGAYAQCKSTLANRTKKITLLVKKEKNKETKLSLQDMVSEIAQKAQEFAEDASNAYFPEVNNQCRDYTKEVDGNIKSYLHT